MRCCRLLAAGLFGCCLLAATSTVSLAQMAKPAAPALGTHVPPAEVFGKLLSGNEKDFVDAVEAMPEEKFNFAPPASYGEYKGVRTFAAEVKHVAEANYYYFRNPDAPLVDNRADIEKLTGKAEIVQALKESFLVAHKYIAGITEENAFVVTKNGTRAGQAAGGIAHFMDHYGQLVEYLRMNGIVPPASRK